MSALAIADNTARAENDFPARKHQTILQIRSLT